MQMARRISYFTALFYVGLIVMGSSSALAYYFPGLNDSVQLYTDNTTNAGFRGDVISPDAPGTADYYTFCLERNEYFYTNTPYSIRSISTSAVSGGVGGGTGGSDPLDYRTAYLYTMFSNGTLFGGQGTVVQRQDLQAAIWFIEEEITTISVGARELVDLAGIQNWTDLGNVRVANYSNGSGTQDHLTQVPEPGMIILFGSGLIALAGFRKKI